MAIQGRRSGFAKWGIIGGVVAGGVLIPLIPAIKKRAMRVTTILKKDHRVLSGLVMTCQMSPRNEKVRKGLFEQIRHSFMIHAQAEEEVLYPALRNFLIVDQSKVDEAYREHQQAKDLLNDLATMDATSEAFEAKLADFKGKIDHHVEEEENEMFPMVKQRMPTEQQEELGRRIHDRKSDLSRRMAA